jgi:hypothetical protein
MLPIEAAIPSRTRVSEKAIDVYCDPASLWWISPSVTA